MTNRYIPLNRLRLNTIQQSTIIASEPRNSFSTAVNLTSEYFSVQLHIIPIYLAIHGFARRASVAFRRDFSLILMTIELLATAKIAREKRSLGSLKEVWDRVVALWLNYLHDYDAFESKFTDSIFASSVFR